LGLAPGYGVCKYRHFYSYFQIYLAETENIYIIPRRLSQWLFNGYWVSPTEKVGKILGTLLNILYLCSVEKKKGVGYDYFGNVLHSNRYHWGNGLDERRRAKAEKALEAKDSS